MNPNKKGEREMEGKGRRGEGESGHRRASRAGVTGVEEGGVGSGKALTPSAKNGGGRWGTFCKCSGERFSAKVSQFWSFVFLVDKFFLNRRGFV
jgi:hypothetical protein